MPPSNDLEKRNREALKEIKTAYRKGNLIPFVGAGFSKNISGYPGWDEFIKKLGDEIGVELNNIFRGNNLEATEYYIWKKVSQLTQEGQITTRDDLNTKLEKGKKKLLEAIKEIVKANSRVHHNNSEWIYHDMMVNKFNYIYTTNWDDTLEVAKSVSGKEVKAIYKKSHLSNVDYAKDKIQIIKLHGHWDDIDAESLIACQKDYNKRILEENPFDIKFKNDLLHKDFFFIGYSFEDPNILLMIDLIYQTIQEVVSKVKIFWISTENFGDLRVELLKSSLGIEPYYLLTKDQQDELSNLKNKLELKCNRCKVKRNTKLSVDILLELCEKCNEILRKSFREKKKKYIKVQTEEFLNKF